MHNLPSISSTIMSDQVWMMIETICGYLDIPTKGLDGFTVHTGRNLDLLDRLRNTHSLGPEQMELVNSQLAREESCYLPDAQVIVLGNLSIRHAAEEASHHINSVKCNETNSSSDPLQHFYEIAIREAIGYIGTKIIDHKRACMDVKELETLLGELNSPSLDPSPQGNSSNSSRLPAPYRKRTDLARREWEDPDTHPTAPAR